MTPAAWSARLGTHSAKLGEIVLGASGQQDLGRPADMSIGRASAGRTMLSGARAAPVISDARYIP